LASAQNECADRPFRPKQWDNKRCAKPCFKNNVTQGLSGTLAKVGNLQRLSLGYRLAEAPSLAEMSNLRNLATISSSSPVASPSSNLSTSAR
jgi:hypothetical protein